MAGEIGQVLSVDFHWLLNTLHGADSFRRWHSVKSLSGGLMVHKASHHFHARRHLQPGPEGGQVPSGGRPAGRRLLDAGRRCRKQVLPLGRDRQDSRPDSRHRLAGIPADGRTGRPRTDAQSRIPAQKVKPKTRDSPKLGKEGTVPNLVSTLFACPPRSGAVLRRRTASGSPCTRRCTARAPYPICRLRGV
jgi:hypothetical protein